MASVTNSYFVSQLCEAIFINNINNNLIQQMDKIVIESKNISYASHTHMTIEITDENNNLCLTENSTL